jgi:cobalt-zinc-cadmium efflux system outer membrane protein
MSQKVILAVILAAAIVAVAQEPHSALANSPASPVAVLKLDDVIRDVIATNPAISAARSTVNAQRRRVVQAGALPDPNFTLSWMGDPVPFKTQAMDPSSYRGISVMQMFPLGGKRELRREMARKEVGAFEADQLATVRRLTAEASSAFYDYFYSDRALAITNRNKGRLQQLAEISEARYRVGKAMQQDVLRAQVEVSMLLQRAVTLEQQRQIAAARLNTLMGRPMDATLPPAAEVKKTSLPAISDLAALAEANDPMLKRERSMVERNKVAIAMARKEFVPDLSVGYMYQQRPGMPDMHGVQFTVDIPIFYKSKQREGVEQAKQELSAAEDNTAARQLELSYQLKQMYAMAVNADKMMSLYTKAIIPQAELALQSAESSYSVGTVDFLTVVTNFTTINGYEIDNVRQLADYQSALARIEALAGDLSQASSKESK